MQLLRIVQYFSMLMVERKLADGTVESALNGKKWISLRESMRSTRKVLRLLRTLEYSRKVIGNIKKIKNGECKTTTELVLAIAEALASACTFLFFMFDHRVLFAEVPSIGIIDWCYLQRQLGDQLPEEHEIQGV